MRLWALIFSWSDFRKVAAVASVPKTDLLIGVDTGVFDLHNFLIFREFDFDLIRTISHYHDSFSIRESPVSITVSVISSLNPFLLSPDQQRQMRKSILFRTSFVSNFTMIVKLNLLTLSTSLSYYDIIDRFGNWCPVKYSSMHCSDPWQYFNIFCLHSLTYWVIRLTDRDSCWQRLTHAAVDNYLGE